MPNDVVPFIVWIHYSSVTRLLDPNHKATFVVELLLKYLLFGAVRTPTLVIMGKGEHIGSGNFHGNL